ncbi:thiamine pyrophosphate-requiring protein [Capillimicrobium parvum]|uniref:thiamine pyrophosphate-requiring protein n=1 Tax=Capillimicrobium parvum TaxID=2884022 RepID=UPI00216B0A30|nr:thiamine pyrophosphate-requiring protein [Capillimicrobium parvum]
MIASALRAEGVEMLSCYPTTPMIDAATRAGIRPVVCRQERVGVGIADGYSRVTAGDGFGVFAMQFGPGAENAFPGIASAFSDGIPMLLLPLGNSLDRAQMRPLFDAAAAYAPVTTFYEAIRRPQDTGEVMRRAVNALRNGVPGPVMVEIPADVATMTVPDGAATYEPVIRARSMADPASVERVAAALGAARRPLIVAGRGVLAAGAAGELVGLAEELGLPVVTTLGGKSAIAETHPLSVGVASVVASDPVVDVLGDADLVLALGASLTRHFLTARLPASASIAQLTRDARDLNKTRHIAHPLVGDAALVLRQLRRAARDAGIDGPARAAAVAERIAKARRSWDRRWEPKLRSDEVPITPYRVLYEFMAATDPDATVVTHDSGSPRDQIVPFYRSGGPNTYLGWGKSHALGAGLGLIMGAKLAAPDRFCVAFVGDAAFGMTGLDIETAQRAGVAIALVVLNNATMAIEIPNMLESHERHRARDIGGDYAGIARALGVEALRVREPGELRPAFEQAQQVTATGRCIVIEVITSAETDFANRRVLSE